MRPRDLLRATVVQCVLLFALPFVVYSNNYRHAYVLDDAYTLVSNPSIRSLREIPKYFVDPATYTTIREQADYRPVLQTTYALNYRMGGYDTRWWHFTQILLHAVVTLGLFALFRRVLLMSGESPASNSIAFASAALFAVHPAASGVVNYFNARSSLLTAAWLLPALVAYMTPVERPGYARRRWLAALLYALALFTKVEAVGLLGALLAFEVWQRQREAPERSLLQSIRASFDTRTLRRMAPAVAVTVIYFIIRWRVMAPFPFDETRHAADVGPYQYFVTQLTAWWYYVYRWIAPVHLVADHLSYPVYRSVFHPVVLIALGAWLIVAALAMTTWRRAPHLLFLGVAALALLSPTSSVAPLAEMVNEHRPYLPLGVLSLALTIPIGVRVGAWLDGTSRYVAAAGSAAVFVALCALTLRRNEVFSTSKRYWEDVIAKAPSSRAHLNYGIALMQLNEMPAALQQFRKSLEIAPNWYYTHINLAVAHRHVGQLDSARLYHDRAVQNDRYSGFALTWRGEFRLSQGDYDGARADFEQSLPLGLHRYRNYKGLATAHAGLGDVDRSVAYTDSMLAIDASAARADIPGVSVPFYEDDRLRAAGIRYYEAIRARLPNERWIDENIARLRNRTDTKTAIDAQQQLMARGVDLLYRQKRPDAAAEQFRAVLEKNPTHYGATYQLAVALDRSGKAGEARPFWVKVLGMATAYGDQRTAAVAREKLK